MHALRVDLYSDIVCPWCFIGTRRLWAAIDSFGESLDAQVRHRPYLLHPEAPPEGIDLAAMLGRRYGIDPKRIFERVETAARDAGIALDLSKQPYSYSTLAAHTLLRHAEPRGTARALLDALFVAYFLEVRNIASTAVLADVAAAHGFTTGEVERLVRDEGEIAQTWREVREAAARGIQGVPFFVLNGSQTISGAQPPAIFRQAIATAIGA